MNQASPLRYPGGKAAMAGLLGQIRKINGLGSYSVAEPFAGGAGASLSLLFREETAEIHINDADAAIHDFWWSLTKRPDQFSKLLKETRVSIAEWRRQRDTYRSNDGRLSRLTRGFSAFYLNRCNRSGIIMNGGPIGGINQTGEWLINARFNKEELGRRCQKIAEYRDRIFVTAKDGVDFVKHQNPSRTFYFIDPPYFEKGKTLYLNALDQEYHARLADQLRSMTNSAWVLTYDDCREIRQLYRGWATIRPFGLRYAASERRNGSEIMIVPKWMKLPQTQRSEAIDW
jgi:DNA adenine methylase